MRQCILEKATLAVSSCFQSSIPNESLSHLTLNKKTKMNVFPKTVLCGTIGPGQSQPAYLFLENLVQT